MFRSAASILAPLLLIGLLAPAGAGAGGDLKWRSFDAGLKEARAARRPVLVDVYTDWCRYCKLMDRDVYSRPDVRDYLARRFVVVRLNAEGRESGTYEGRTQSAPELARRFRINAYPTTVFLRSDGGQLVNVPGYLPADQFLVLLRYVGEGAFERGEDWDSFARRASGGR